jgi:hypothetical protein
VREYMALILFLLLLLLLIVQGPMVRRVPNVNGKLNI